MRSIALAITALAIVATPVAAADCTAEVDNAFEKLRKTTSFRMETTISNPAGSMKMSNDYVLPDRMHQSVTMTDGAPGKMEMILVAGKAWSNQGNAGWAPVPDDFASTIAKQMKETVAEPPKQPQKFECLGEVTLEGKTYNAYRAKAAAQNPDGTPPKPDANNVQTVYVDKEKGIPVRNIVTPENDPSKRLFDGTFSVVEGLKIEPPKL